MLDWSNFDEVLEELQRLAGQPIYKFYGDKAYFGGAWDCFAAAHQETAGLPLTDRKRLENSNMNKARVSIEWSYGHNKQLWEASNSGKYFKILQDDELIYASFRVMHLLTDCVTCFRGNVISGQRSFACPPPSLDEYLIPHPDP
jgi:hypothetical protein